MKWASSSLCKKSATALPVFTTPLADDLGRHAGDGVAAIDEAGTLPAGKAGGKISITNHRRAESDQARAGQNGRRQRGQRGAQTMPRHADRCCALLRGPRQHVVAHAEEGGKESFVDLAGALPAR